jgi:hypothetical protein
MKRETTLPPVRNITLGIALMTACGIIQFSCKKPANSDLTSKGDLTKTAALVKGTVLYGSLTSDSDDQEVSLTYNDGQKYIILEKLAGAANFSANIPSAGLVLSDYGVIIKDESKNSYLFLTNNDPTSIEQFKMVEAQLSGSVQHSLIYGVTVVNAARE